MHSKKSRRQGFTLVELMVAMAVFMVIGGAAIKLVRAHMPLVSSSQNQAGLNMALRSVAAQMQLDAVNAGSGYSEVSPANTWNMGIVVGNRVTTTDCHDPATFVYSGGCFDSFSIVANDTTRNRAAWISCWTRNKVQRSRLRCEQMKSNSAILMRRPLASIRIIAAS